MRTWGEAQTGVALAMLPEGVGDYGPPPQPVGPQRAAVTRRRSHAYNPRGRAHEGSIRRS